MTDKEIKRILENHLHWINKDVDGWENMRAYLTIANLTGLDLREVDLRGANLIGANLEGTILTGANLEEVSMLNN